MFIVVPMMLASLYFAVSPHATVIEARQKRSGVSPLIDFMISKYKPQKWWCVAVELFRRLICTSGLLVVPHNQAMLITSICINVLFSSVYDKLDPFFDPSTNNIQMVRYFHSFDHFIFAYQQPFRTST